MDVAAGSASRGRIDRLAMIAGPLAILALIVWMGGWTGDPAIHNGLIALGELARNGPWAVAWIAAAFGLGWPLRSWLARESRDGLAIQSGLGVAAMLTLDCALGRAGWLSAGGGAGAWMLLGLGLALLLIQALRWRGVLGRRNPDAERRATWPPAPPALVWTAAPAVAVLLLAATSAPGWLWASEFGGYDAMSYHLQLPKEWLALGRITPLDHNVYSFLPGFVEAAYTHLATLIGDGIESAVACQLLHAAMTILTAAVVGRLALRLMSNDRDDARIGALAAVIMLGTPWVVVVGSLAYNEMATALMLATGMLVMFDETSSPARRGTMIGLLAGAACGAKLTALGFVAIPLGLLLAHSAGRRGWITAVLSAALVGSACLAPWLLANWFATGNPVFPFATGVFGSAHWTAEQVAAWSSGHMPGTGLLERAVQAWRQLFSYGLGPNPDPAEPWLPQWSILPWLAIPGLIIAWSRGRWGNAHAAKMLSVVLVVQFVFWLLFTHVKSRFMLPAVVPGAAALALGAAELIGQSESQRRSRLSGSVLALLGLAWSCLPVIIFARECDGRPAADIDMLDTLTGDALTEADREEWGRSSFPWIAVNYLLPRGSKVLLVGDARPLYFRANVVYQTTWDRGPLSAAMRKFENPAAWNAVLVNEGFTHVLVDPVMLKRWEKAGWNDPLITSDRVMSMLAGARVVAQYESGIAIYELPRSRRAE